MKCHICSNSSGQEFIVREMMFGFRDEFTYWQCQECECLQIVTPPSDLSKYYPRNYYSFSQYPTLAYRPLPGSFRYWIWRQRNEAQLFNKSGIWGIIAALRPRPDVKLPIEIRNVPRLKLSSRILDVGCGSGGRLFAMYQIGFENLTGIDPYMSPSNVKKDGIRLLAVNLKDVDDGPYDLIMFHHSLEHMSDQHEAINHAKRLLSNTGTCLVRIPTVSSTVWEHYRTDWVELDAPRHFYLHSHKSLQFLCQSHGLFIAKLWCDSDGFAYAGSELYCQQMSLVDPLTGKQRRLDAHFSREQLEYFNSRAAEDNKCLRGGRLVAYLQHAV